MPKAERKARIPSADGGVPQARNHLAFIHNGAAPSAALRMFRLNSYSLSQYNPIGNVFRPNGRIMCVSIDESKKFGYSVTIKIKHLFNR